jgi:hypothetical protein
METETAFPVLYGRRIKNTGDLKDALCATMADVVAGRITPKEGNAINRAIDRGAARILQSVLAGIDYGIGRRRPQWSKQD